MAASSSSSSKKVILLTSDSKEYEVEKHVAMHAATLRRCLDEDVVLNKIPLTNVDSKNLEKVIEYSRKHTENNEEEGDISHWDAKFVEGMSVQEIHNLVMAAHLLEIKGLMDLTCRKLADAIKDMSVPEVRRLFDIENNFTPEEEAEVIEEHAWAHEGY